MQGDLPSVMPVANPAIVQNAFITRDQETFIADAWGKPPVPLMIQQPEVCQGSLPALKAL